jgi:riboflavin kinase/FMN adenylyltransferase
VNVVVADETANLGLPSDGRGTVVTVGTFDGVHRGHWEVLRAIRKRAHETGCRSVLVTFDPHPLRVVRPEDAPPLLTTPVEKKEILAESGLEWAVFLTFTPELARYSPERFVEEILVRKLDVRELVIGYDHGFGRGRSGDVDTLRHLGEQLSFGVIVVPPVSGGGDAISSSRIRGSLESGEVEAAAGALGRPYAGRGRVVRGEGRGRALGFPTANLQVHAEDKLIPRSGIYAVRAALRRGSFDGALHLGPRPTFPDASPAIEVHLMDFDDVLYGEEIRVDFIRRLREVRFFSTAEALIEQMHEDVMHARKLLSGAGDDT